MSIYCTNCNSYEVMCGEPSENVDGEITVTYVCLDCGDAWEVSEEND